MDTMINTLLIGTLSLMAIAMIFLIVAAITCGFADTTPVLTTVG